MPVRRVRREPGAVSRHPLPGAVVVPGETVTSWSNRRQRSAPATAPNAVAVDGEGRVCGYGLEALQQSGRSGNDLALVRPFTSTRIRHPELAAAFVRWLLRARGRRPSRAPTAILVPSNPTAEREWSSFVSELSIPAVTLSRPLAATAGFGLETTDAAHMVLIADQHGAEIAVVADGAVVFSRQVQSSLPQEVSAQVRSALRHVDPDLEWEVAERGVHLVANGLSGRWVSILTESINMGVVAADLQTMVDGARTSLEVVGYDLRLRGRLTIPLGRGGRPPAGLRKQPPRSGYSSPSW